MGRLTRDPELRSTNNGKYLCRFSLSCNRTIFQKDAENRDEVSFFECVAWGKLAEVISKYVQKGRRVAIDGSLRQSTWENAEGKKQSKVEINVENFQFLDPKGSQQGESFGGEQPAQAQAQAPAQSAPVESGFEEPFNEDDIPF